MSKLLISQYHNEVDKIINYSGFKKETSIRIAFQNLLNSYCQTRNFLLIPELDYRTKSGKIVYPDGTIKDALRLDWGYWESKDQDDNLDAEIEKKLAKGYPDDRATVYTDLDNLSLILDFSPPNPPIMGGIGIESPPKLGDLGGNKVFNYNRKDLCVHSSSLWERGWG